MLPDTIDGEECITESMSATPRTALMSLLHMVLEYTDVGAFSFIGRSGFVQTDQRLNSQLYVAHILRPHVRPLLAARG